MFKVTPALNLCLIAALLLGVGACSSGDSPSANLSSGAATRAPSSRSDAGTEESDKGDSLEVIAESLPYAEVNDELTYGYFAFPANMVDALPAVLVVHDRWGLNDDVKDHVERLAAGGYIVLGIDLFSGKSTGQASEARELEIAVLEDRATAQENIRQAIDFVRNSSSPPSVSIVGFGFGGSWALNAALVQPDELGAAISYYGQVTTEESEIQSLDVPFLGFFAETDRAVPIADALAFSNKATMLSKDVEIRTFADARRGFAEASADTFDPGATKEAWTQMLTFLDTRVRH